MIHCHILQNTGASRKIVNKKDPNCCIFWWHFKSLILEIMLLYEGLKETGDFLDWGHEAQQGHLIETVNFHYLTFFSNMQRNKESVGCFIREGPFHIRGRGAWIFPRNKLFFFSLLHNKSFFKKYTAKSFFYTIKLEKCKQKQHKE